MPAVDNLQGAWRAQDSLAECGAVSIPSRELPRPFYSGRHTDRRPHGTGAENYPRESLKKSFVVARAVL